MLNDYFRAAMRLACYQIQDDDSVYGEIPGFDDVRATGDTLERCQQELLEALEEWVFFRVSRKLPLPIIEGIQLPHYEVM